MIPAGYRNSNAIRTGRGRLRTVPAIAQHAGVRAGISLIGFGFAIFQFFYKFHQSPEFTDARFPNAAWYFGLALIFCGIMAALLSILQYRWTLRYLWSGGFAAIAGMASEAKQTPLYAMSFLLVLIGLFAFFAVLLRLV